MKYLKYIFINVYLVFLISQAVCGQTKINIDKACGYYGEYEGNNEIVIKKASKKYSEIIDSICSKMSIINKYKIYEAPIGNAVALYYQGQYIIIIDPIFLTEIADGTKSNFSIISILAHEVGHHILGHSLKPASLNDPNRPVQELEADEYSGKVLNKINVDNSWGSSINYAVDIKKHPALVYNGYPGNLERKAAIFNGLYNGYYFSSPFDKKCPKLDSIKYLIKRKEIELSEFLNNNAEHPWECNPTTKISNGILTHIIVDRDKGISEYNIDIAKITYVGLKYFSGYGFEVRCKPGGLKIKLDDSFKYGLAYHMTALDNGLLIAAWGENWGKNFSIICSKLSELKYLYECRNQTTIR